MNIISNCCAGGELYRQYIGEFTNPFIWCALEPIQIVKLIDNYDNINFNNIKIVPSNMHNFNNIYKIIIDNKITVHYTHYKYLKGCKFKQEGLNIFREDALNYVEERYNSRLKRMQKLNEKPYFLILDNKYDITFTLDDVNNLVNLKSPYKIIFVSDKDLSNITFPKNIKWIKDNGWDHVKICKNYHNEIINFFNNKD